VERAGATPRPSLFSWGILRLMQFSRLLMAAVVLSAVLFAGTALVAGPGRTLAGPESDIPGIPLPDAVVSGQLGGPIYDVVYRLDVPAGHVIVAGLTGAAGTDFDLYLFDSTATTVVSNGGLLAKSTGPASAENLSFPSRDGGTYYLDLNGATDVQGAYILTVQLVADATPPVVSLQIGGGKMLVNSTTVEVRLLAFDDLSGVSDMAFSEDGVLWGSWQRFQPISSWTFAPGDGVKRLWAKVRNGVGQASQPVASAVTVDTAPPTVVSVSPAPNMTHQGLRPTIVVRFSEAVDPSSWTELGLVVQAANGVRVDGAYTYDRLAFVGSFVPAADLGAGTAYIVTVGKVRDVAGNEIEPTGSWTLTVVLPNAVTLAAAPAVITVGGRVTLSGAVSVATGGPVSILERAAATGEPIATTPIELAGRTYSSVVIPAANTWYQATYPGSAVTLEVSSPLVRVIVRRGIALLGRSPATNAAAHTGEQVTLTAQVTPALFGVHVSYRLYQYETSRRAYRYAGSWGRRSDVGGRSVLQWTPTAGRYYWRVAVLSTPDYANNTTPAYRWSVSP